MPICLVCQSQNLPDIDDALMSGVSVRGIASRFGLSKSGVARHRAGCLQPKLAAAARIIAPASEVRSEVLRAKDIVSGAVTATPGEVLSLTGLLARLERSLERLECSADSTASQGLHTALAAVSGQLHRGIEAAAKIQGFYAEPVDKSGSTALQINITLPSGLALTKGVDAPLVVLENSPTLNLSMSPVVAYPWPLESQDFALTDELSGSPETAHFGVHSVA